MSVTHSPAALVSRVQWVVGVVVLLILTGCSAPDGTAPPERVLIRIDGRTVTLTQFERAFEAARIAYSDDRSADAEQIGAARRRLLDQMTEEVVVDRRAEELGITLDEVQLEAAIDDIKRDYPEGEFTQMLLESAIPLDLWKERLRSRLLMGKVIERDLVQQLTLTTQDIEAYYKAHEAELVADMQTPSEADLPRRIVKRLRRQKVEAAYLPWMDALRQRYGVKIDWTLWEQIHTSGSADQRKE